jgi:hypothetical protein
MIGGVSHSVAHERPVHVRDRAEVKRYVRKVQRVTLSTGRGVICRKNNVEAGTTDSEIESATA